MNATHLPQYPLNGTQLECDGSELRPDGTCAKCERINARIASHYAATPTDVDERARRVVRRLDDAGYIDKDMVQMRGSCNVGAVVVDIITAEFQD